MAAQPAWDSGGRALPFIGIMAKAPRPGHAKTRLAQAFPPAVAADLYRHFLLDTIEALSGLVGIGSVALGLVCPPGDAPDLRDLARGLLVVEQPVSGLMQGLAFGIEHFLQAGYSAVILVNADSPTLPPECIDEALQALTSHDVVLGPTSDGGYYLIGAKISCTHLLCDEPYTDGTTVCAETLLRARRLGLHITTISSWYDIDLPSEVVQLASALEDQPLHVAAHTRHALASYHAVLRALAESDTKTGGSGASG